MNTDDPPLPVQDEKSTANEERIPEIAEATDKRTKMRSANNLKVEQEASHAPVVEEKQAEQTDEPSSGVGSEAHNSKLAPEPPVEAKQDKNADRLASVIALALGTSQPASNQDLRSSDEPATYKQFVTMAFDGGRPHIVPWKICCTWPDMEEFIKLYYNDDQKALREVSSGGYELQSSTYGVIVPQLWEQVVEPNWHIIVQLLSRVEKPPAAKLTEPSKPGGLFRKPESIAEAEENEELVETKYEKTVRYTVSYFKKGGWRGDREEFLGKSTYSDPIEFDLSRNQAKVLPVLEETKKVTSQHMDGKQTQRTYGTDDTGKRPKLGPQDKVSGTKLQVHSQHLLNVLRSIVDYSSELPQGDRDSFSDGSFEYPYKDLYHYKAQLEEYKSHTHGLRAKHSESFNQQADEHIDVLLDYLENQSSIPWRQSVELSSRKVPVTTFAGVWLLFKPGSDVYVGEADGSLNAYVVDRVTGGVFGDHGAYRAVTPHEVILWNLSYDGGKISKRRRAIIIPVFDNEREIVSLPAFPVRFVDQIDAGALRTRLVGRGKQYFQYSKGPAFLEYTGYGLKPGLRKYKAARVVVEHSSAPWKHKDFVPLGPDWQLDRRENSSLQTPMSLRHESIFMDDYPRAPPSMRPESNPLGMTIRIPRCECKECKPSPHAQGVYTAPRFNDYSFEPKKKETLTEHQYLLLSPRMYAFMLKDRAYDLLDVFGLSEPRFSEKAIDRLVMDSKNKETIKAIAKTYTDETGQAGRFSADFIYGKGEGQIMLLHGPPGTGKTLTAESVAEFVKRPLLSITAADLGHEPEILEKNLLTFFRNANDWDAIVLLDEADVYLTQRSISDLRRNSIVSIFLRALDYFQGILFLTTNRVGQFDEAFMARIHVSIGYERLNNEARSQIWDNLFEKLNEDRDQGIGREINYVYDAKEYVRTSEVMDLKWNGREIRNAFQTAVALAVFDANSANEKASSNAPVVPKVKESHLKQVVAMSSAFKLYMKSTHENIDDSDLAYKRGIRNDQFQLGQ